MNNGTIIRTILVVATCLNTAMLSTDFAQFNNPTVDMAYRIISVILNFIIVACATWYNNDFTPTAAQWTGGMRAEKARLKGGTDGLDVEIDEYIEDGDDDE